MGRKTYKNCKINKNCKQIDAKNGAHLKYRLKTFSSTFSTFRKGGVKHLGPPLGKVESNF